MEKLHGKEKGKGGNQIFPPGSTLSYYANAFKTQKANINSKYLAQ